MSLAETQQIMQVLQEIIAILDKVDIKATKVTNDLPKIKRTLTTFRELERLALRYLALTRKMGLPDDVEKQIEVLAKIVVLARMAQISLGLMSGNPLQVMIGFGGVLTMGMTVKDMMQMG